MGDLEKLAGIPKSKANLLDERFRRSFHDQPCSVPLTPRLATSLAGSADRSSHTWREPDLLDQLCRIGIVDPEAERLAKATPCLIKRPAVGVAPANARHARDPGADLVSLEDHAISAFAFHSNVKV